MKILVNLSSQKMGGGLTVATNFVSAIVNNPDSFGEMEFLFVIVKNSSLKKLLVKSGYSFIEVSSNPVIRILTEIFYISFIIYFKNIDAIYNYFHYGFYITQKQQIVGTADSNIYYPEIRFWNNLSTLSLIKKRLIDNYRIFGVKNANGVIFENPSLEQRGKKLYGLKKTIYIKPAVECFESNSHQNNTSKNLYTGLFLCSWQENKNYKIIPQILNTARLSSFPLKIIFTAPLDDSVECKDFQNQIKNLKLEDHIIMTGTISKVDLQNLYNQVDFIFLLSNLESFSNNIIESWLYKRLLIISDLEWARSICGNAVLYVDRNNPNDIVHKLKMLMSDLEEIKKILEEGSKKLMGYNTALEKAKREIFFIKKVISDN